MKTLETTVYLTDNPDSRRVFVSLPVPDDEIDELLRARTDEHLRDGWQEAGSQRLTKDGMTVEFLIRGVVIAKQEPTQP